MEGQREKLISVIVPIYNVDSYLSQCVESLLAQTYGNIEILLIDDGSTDNSGTIADSYVERDNRVSVFHQDNEGISAARNRGLDAMTGDYVMFVDGDDFVEANFCEGALNMIQQHHVEIVSFGYNLFWNREKCFGKAIDKPRLLNKEGMMKDFIKRTNSLNYSWNKMFSRSLFDGIRFPVGRTYEDAATIYKLIDRSSTDIYVSDRILYNYRQDRAGSVNSQSRSNNVIHDRLLAEFERLEFVDSKYPRLKGLQIDYMVGLCMLGLTFLPRDHDDMVQIKQFLRSNKRDCITDTSGLRRFRLLAYYFLPPLFTLMNMLLKKYVYHSPIKKAL